MLRSTLLSAIPRIAHGFQLENEPEPEGLVSCHQVHGAVIVRAENREAFAHGRPQADGLITMAAAPVGVQTADCLPVLFASRSGGAVAAVHAGWRGLHRGILPAAVRELGAAGVRAGEVVAVIGPAIGQCCYEIDESTWQAFEKDWGWLFAGAPRAKNPPSPGAAASLPWIYEERGPRPEGQPANNWWIDLKTIARLQLQDAGIPPSQIEDLGVCTYCAQGGLASYRRACHEIVQGTRPAPGPGTRIAGRQWSWIARTR